MPGCSGSSVSAWPRSGPGRRGPGHRGRPAGRLIPVPGPGRVSASRSVAGEAQEVPGVVGELVDVHVVAEDRGRTLVEADEVVHREVERDGAEEPEGRPGAGHDDGRGPGGGQRGRGHRGASSGILRPSYGPWTVEGLTRQPGLGWHTVARPCRFLTGFLLPSRSPGSCGRVQQPSVRGRPWPGR